jgi:aryl-alcohol dehydrogenase-like predicted oxidoreductase
MMPQVIRIGMQCLANNLVIVTKIGARRGADGSWLPAFTPAELTEEVHDNLRNLGLDAMEVLTSSPA